MAAGVLTWQIIQTMGTINKVSTPPPIVSGSALGGSPEVQIETGPARTAMAAAKSSQTPTATAMPDQASTARSTDIPQPTSTAVPTEQPTDMPESGAFPPADLNPPGTSATPDASTEPTEDPDLPTEIDVPVDNLTPTSPAITTPGNGDDSDLPTEIDVPIDNLTPTPPADAYPEAGENPDLPTEIDVPIDNLTPGPPGASGSPGGPFPESGEDPDLPTEISVPIDNLTPESAAGNPEPPVATPEAVLLSEIERVQNGNFEQGSAAWYLESGAELIAAADAPEGTNLLQIPATGGYADQAIFTIPGTTYQLTGVGRLTKKGDSGSLGVVYYDANQTRLKDLEPEPITFSATKFTTGALEFTPPPNVAVVKVFAYKETGRAMLEIDHVSIRSIIPASSQESSSTASAGASNGAMTILVMGVDAREDESIDGSVRPDSLMLVHLNPASSSCRVLSIPRDTRTELPGYGLSKVNHALALGGVAYEVQVVSDLVNLPIDHYVLIDFSGFQDLVDALGGVTITVPEPFTAVDGTVFAAGEQHMNGTQALTYSRHRGDLEGDFGRIERQQQVIRALIRETSGLEVLSSVRELLPAVAENLRTDFDIPEMVDMANTYRSICTEDAITLMKLEGQIATFDDPILKMPLSYVVVDDAEIRRKVASLLEP